MVPAGIAGRFPARRRRSALVAGVLVAMVPWLAGCDRAPREPANDTTAVPEPAVEESTVDAATAATAAAIANGWPVEDAGSWLVVPSPGSMLSAQLVFPQYTDSTLTTATRFALDRIGEQRVELFTPAGRVGSARLLPPEPAAAQGCTAWPQSRVLADSEPLGPWSVAFAAGLAQPIPLDSIAGLSPADSAQLAAQIARIASVLPEDSTSLFRGLPFIVRSARRFTPVAGVQAVATAVVRRVSSEATPVAEHLFIIAERPAGTPLARYAPVYLERVSGREETLEIVELLAAVALGTPPDRRPTLVVNRDYGDGTAFSLVERVSAQRWRLRWSSAYAGC